MYVPRHVVHLPRCDPDYYYDDDVHHLTTTIDDDVVMNFPRRHLIVISKNHARLPSYHNHHDVYLIPSWILPTRDHHHVGHRHSHWPCFRLLHLPYYVTNPPYLIVPRDVTDHSPRIDFVPTFVVPNFWSFDNYGNWHDYSDWYGCRHLRHHHGHHARIDDDDGRMIHRRHHHLHRFVIFLYLNMYSLEISEDLCSKQVQVPSTFASSTARIIYHYSSCECQSHRCFAETYSMLQNLSFASYLL